MEVFLYIALSFISNYSFKLFRVNIKIGQTSHYVQGKKELTTLKFVPIPNDKISWMKNSSTFSLYMLSPTCPFRASFFLNKMMASFTPLKCPIFRGTSGVYSIPNFQLTCTSVTERSRLSYFFFIGTFLYYVPKWFKNCSVYIIFPAYEISAYKLSIKLVWNIIWYIHRVYFYIFSAYYLLCFIGQFIFLSLFR